MARLSHSFGTTSVEGIHRAEALLNQTASRVAQAGDSDVVSLSDEAVALIQAKIAVAANVKAFRAAADIQKSLIDLLG